MNWIHAYIEAVRTNLPREKREDIGEELRTILEESLESETGRRVGELSEEEGLAWLRTREHPSLVAARYQERRCLVDEDCFPLFKLTLRYVLAGLTVGFAALAFLSAVASGDGNYSVSLTGLAADILRAGLMAFAVVTLVFHFFGKAFSARSCLAKWNPADLPDPSNKWEQEPWSSSVGGLVCSGIAMLFLNGFLPGLAGAASRWSFAEVKVIEEAVAMLPWINLALGGWILLHAYMLLKPRWSVASLAASMALSAGGALILYGLQGVQPMLALAGASPEDAERVGRLVQWANQSARIALLVVLAFTLYELVRCGWRMTRIWGRRWV